MFSLTIFPSLCATAYSQVPIPAPELDRDGLRAADRADCESLPTRDEGLRKHNNPLSRHISQVRGWCSPVVNDEQTTLGGAASIRTDRRETGARHPEKHELVKNAVPPPAVIERMLVCTTQEYFLRVPYTGQTGHLLRRAVDTRPSRRR